MQRDPFEGPVTLRVSGEEQAISPHVAQYVLLAMSE